MTNLVDVVKLAVALNTMSDQQLQAYTAMRSGGIDETTIASLIGKGIESGVKSSVKEYFKPDYMTKWRAVTFEPIAEQSITVADYEARITTMIARLNTERVSFVTAFPDSKMGEYALTGGASRARGTKTLHDRNYNLLGAAWYPIGQLNQANTELCEFNGWESGTIETVSAPNTWIARKVKVGDKLVTLEGWYDENIANDDSEDGAE